MQLAAGFAFAGFLILITGGGKALLDGIKLDRGRAAALLLLLTILSAFKLEFAGLSIHPGSLILYLVLVLLALREEEAQQMLLTAGFGGILGFLLLCLFRNATEQGLILLLPGILLLLFPGESRQGSIYGAMLLPFFAGIWRSIEESCLFERFYLELGSSIQLDAALGILLLTACFQAFNNRVFPRFRRFFPATAENGDQD